MNPAVPTQAKGWFRVSSARLWLRCERTCVPILGHSKRCRAVDAESRQISAGERPVVFVGPYEHHSNELPWRESLAEVVVIAEDADGHIDLGDLERQLTRFAGRPLLIGSFPAASNVTGILTDTSAVAALLHARGALSFSPTQGRCRSPRPHPGQQSGPMALGLVYPGGYLAV